MPSELTQAGLQQTVSVKLPEAQHDAIELAGSDRCTIHRIHSTIELVDETLRERRATRTPELSVIIPVYNEAGTIRQVIESVVALNVTKQVIIVDDGSTDGTRDVLATYRGQAGIEVLLHNTNQGKGAALQNGFRMATGDIVIVQDADLEYNPSDILKVIEPIQNGTAAVVYGSRYLDNAVQDQSFVHRLGNAILTGLSNLMTGQRLTDMETCYKAFRRDLLHSIQIEQRRFGFEPEITAKLARRRVPITEVAIGYQSRSWDEGKKIGIRDLVSTLWCIFRYRFG